MVRRPQDKGREAENFAVSFLKERGWPYMERKRLRGAKDEGDLTGAPGLMFEIKYLGARVSPRMAAWMKQVQVQTEHANADFGVLIVKPPNVGGRNAGKFWAVMAEDSFSDLFMQASASGRHVPIAYYAHSNARLTTLPARIAELDRLPGHEWVISIPPRGQKEQGLAVMTLERLVPILRTAGYGSPE
jgi:hypothetical protein